MNKTILAVAILTMAAFAGVMIVGDDTDAATPTQTITVKNVVGEGELTYDSGALSGTVNYNKESDSRGFFIEFTIAIGAGNFITYVDYDGETVQSIAADAKGDVKFILQVDKETVGDGKKFTYAVTPSAQTSIAGLQTYDITLDDVILGPIPPSTLTWMADGIVIATGDTKRTGNGTELDPYVYSTEIPAQAPSKTHYNFVGWKIDGVTVITYNAGLEDGKKYVLVKDLVTTEITSPEEYLVTLKEDTVLDAVFEPVNHIINLMVDGKPAGTITAPYGSTIVEPKLPEGYVAWCTVSVAEDGTEIWTPFVFDKTIDMDYTLVAKPKAASAFDVTFKLFDGKADVIQKSDSMVIPDTTREGYLFQGWVIQGGTEYVNPVEYVKTITDKVTFVAVYKVATGAEYNVTFELYGDKDPVTQKANSMTVPDTTREGYDFMGWVVKGSSDYVNPIEYVQTITADTTFVAVYKAVEVVEFTVTFINGEEVVDTVKVVKDALVDEIDAPEGMFWLFDFETPITADVTIEAKPLTVTVQFAVGEKVYNAYTQTVAYGEKIDVTKLADFIFPEGYDSWNCDFNKPIIADMTVYAKVIPAPEKEPAFYQTPLGQCAIILAVFVVGLVFYGIFTGKITVPKFKISRAEKTEAPVEQVEEEKKP